MIRQAPKVTAPVIISKAPYSTGSLSIENQNPPKKAPTAVMTTFSTKSPLTQTITKKRPALTLAERESTKKARTVEDPVRKLIVKKVQDPKVALPKSTEVQGLKSKKVQDRNIAQPKSTAEHLKAKDPQPDNLTINKVCSDPMVDVRLLIREEDRDCSPTVKNSGHYEA